MGRLMKSVRIDSSQRDPTTTTRGIGSDQHRHNLTGGRVEDGSARLTRSRLSIQDDVLALDS